MQWSYAVFSLSYQMQSQGFLGVNWCLDLHIIDLRRLVIIEFVIGVSLSQIHTIPQGVIDMNQCSDVFNSQEFTGHQYSIGIKAQDKTTYIKGTSKDEISRLAVVYLYFSFMPFSLRKIGFIMQPELC